MHVEGALETTIARAQRMGEKTSHRRPYGALLGLGLLAGCMGAIDPDADKKPPSNLTAGPMGGGVHLTWKDNSTDEDEFEIERKISGAPGFARLATVPFDAVSYHDADVSFGTSYTYRVRAKIGAGFSAYSNEATADPGSTGTAGGSAGTGGGIGTAGGSAGGSTGSAGGGSMGAAGGSTGAAGGSMATAGGSSGTGGGSGGSAGGAAGGAVAVVSFRTSVVPALVATCGTNNGSCHAAAQAVGRSMSQYGPCKVIWFSSVDAPLGAYSNYPTNTVATGCPDLTLYQRLMQQHSMLCDGATWQARARYVIPGDLQNSLLYQVIAGDASYGNRCRVMTTPVARMPKIDAVVNPGGRALTTAEIDSIRDWILQGAPNN